MLSHAVEEAELEQLDLESFVAGKWDGIGAQLVARNGEQTVQPEWRGHKPFLSDLLAEVDFDAVLDGELLVAFNGHVASFNDLQQRLVARPRAPSSSATIPPT